MPGDTQAISGLSGKSNCLGIAGEASRKQIFLGTLHRPVIFGLACMPLPLYIYAYKCVDPEQELLADTQRGKAQLCGLLGRDSGSKAPFITGIPNNTLATHKFPSKHLTCIETTCGSVKSNMGVTIRKWPFLNFVAS